MRHERLEGIRDSSMKEIYILAKCLIGLWTITLILREQSIFSFNLRKYVVVSMYTIMRSINGANFHRIQSDLLSSLLYP